MPLWIVRAAGLLLLLVSGCQQTSTQRAPPPPPSEWLYASEHEVPQPRAEQGLPDRSTAFPLEWKPGQALLQGYLGAIYLTELSLDSGANTIELDEDEYEVLPVIGGGAQFKLAGGRVLDFGIEGMLAFSGRSDLAAFASSGGATVVAFDVTLLLFEAYGGPFVSRFLGDRVRIYGSAGPLLQWVSYDPENDSSTDEANDENGSGGGAYARAGLEFLLKSGRLVGFGARWTESSIDVGGDFGDLDLGGIEVFFSYSYGLQPSSRFEW